MIDFLNELFKAYRMNVRITDLTYLNTEDNGEVEKDKHIVLDLKCESQDGDVILVEMQKRGQEHFDDRVLYYMNRCVTEQGEPGDEMWKFGFKKVYGIFLMNFNDKMNPDAPAVRRCGWYDFTSRRSFGGLQEFWLVNLPKFRQILPESCRTGFDCWLYIISNIKKMTQFFLILKRPKTSYQV